MNFKYYKLVNKYRLFSNRKIINSYKSSSGNKLQYQLDRINGALFYFQTSLVQSVNKSETNSEEVKDEVVD